MATLNTSLEKGTVVRACPPVWAGLSHSAKGHSELALNLLHRFREVNEMLYYAIVFLVIALVAALLGFGGVAIAFAGVAKILFVVFLIMFLVSLVMHVGRRV